MSPSRRVLSMVSVVLVVVIAVCDRRQSLRVCMSCQKYPPLAFTPSASPNLCFSFFLFFFHHLSSLILSFSYSISLFSLKGCSTKVENILLLPSTRCIGWCMCWMHWFGSSRGAMRLQWWCQWKGVSVAVVSEVVGGVSRGGGSGIINGWCCSLELQSPRKRFPMKHVQN
jgi:hypothetical protein